MNVHRGPILSPAYLRLKLPTPPLITFLTTPTHNPMEFPPVLYSSVTETKKELTMGRDTLFPELNL
ncbi:hypothetical protein E2C01_047260 [Portunus trituberculatus]|uniref:Uncharacterized protein n=1 Tax=Portunus trituberculatus TaxID=210409 RepID=A0A5B7G0N3_PORTR|nr:hypothetical protein [Portunus trituberculatus]